MQYHGLDLPEYPADTPVLFTKPEFREAARSGQDRILRVASVIGPWGLQESLEIAKQQFSEIAQACGAEAIDVNYGLCQLPDRQLSELDVIKYRLIRGSQEILPAGQFLVADVETVKHAADLSPDEIRDKYLQIRDNYLIPRRDAGAVRIDDVTSADLVMGHARYNQAGFKYVDVDARLVT